MHNPLAESFSAAAATYDAHAAAQRLAAAELLAFTAADAPRTILEAGCGTGIYTRLLRSTFPAADILAIDVAEGMLQQARRRLPGVTFRRADAECFREGHYDLVTANATVHWFSDLTGSLARLARRLTPAGTLSFSFFGPDTYHELDAALRAVFGDAACVASRRFASEASLCAAMQSAFPAWEIRERRFTHTFPSLRALLLSIRHTGTRGPGPSLPWTPRRLLRVEAAYLAQEGAINGVSV